jgi:hypothetical protein
VHEHIQDWLQLAEGHPVFQLMTEKNYCIVIFFFFHQHCLCIFLFFFCLLGLATSCFNDPDQRGFIVIFKHCVSTSQKTHKKHQSVNIVACFPLCENR